MRGLAYDWFLRGCRDDADGRLLRKHSRQFNNALALASEMYDEVQQDGWAPSIVIEGRLYHQVGPLQAEDGARPAFAQLYVHDPAAADDEALRRANHMRVSATERVASDRVKCARRRVVCVPTRAW